MIVTPAGRKKNVEFSRKNDQKQQQHAKRNERNAEHEKRGKSHSITSAILDFPFEYGNIIMFLFV